MVAFCILHPPPPKWCPGARFSKVPKSFRARKATRKILNLKFTELFISHNFNTNKVSFHASLMPIHCFLSEIQIIKNFFTGPISYRVFRETGPWGLDCKTVVYFAYVRHTSARASARSSNGSRKVSECKKRPLRELDAKITGPFLEGPEKFSDPESHNKNLKP